MTSSPKPIGFTNAPPDIRSGWFIVRVSGQLKEARFHEGEFRAKAGNLIEPDEWLGPIEPPLPDLLRVTFDLVSAQGEPTHVRIEHLKEARAWKNPCAVCINREAHCEQCLHQDGSENWFLFDGELSDG